MSLIKSVGAGEQSTGFYKHLLDQSLRFNDADSPYLHRTPASQGSLTTFTFSFWYKRCKFGTYQEVLHVYPGSGERSQILFMNNDTLKVELEAGNTNHFLTNMLFKDPSAWYNVVVTFDSTNGTQANRVKIYVNGVDQSGTGGSGFSTANYPSQNATSGFNTTSQHEISTYDGSDYHLDGYLAEVNFIDGTALTADSFGETKDGIWIPKDTSGLTFGTNGFHLTFKDDVISEGFNTVTYTGTGADNSISGIGFEPALVWIKSRSNTYDNQLYDTVRGPTKRIFSNKTDAELTGSDLVQSFDADGFTIGTNVGLNNSGSTYVGWCWEADTAFSNDTSATSVGNVDSEGKTNTAKGFSIIKWTYSTSADNLVAHGLDSAPTFMLVKSRSTAYNWDVYHSGLSAATKRLNLNTNGAESSGFFDTAPTDTVFEYNTSAATNGDNMIAYCWHDVSGYSKFGSYSGSGSSGKSVTGLGFRPAWLMIKSSSGATHNWNIYDNTRKPTSPNDLELYADLNNAEADSGRNIEFTDDGFDLNQVNYMNQSGVSYIYMAFADTREAAFFKDVSTNGNHFTPVNLDYRDSVPDVPTNNFCTLNPLDNDSMTLSEGNLQGISPANAHNGVGCTFSVTGGKWYWEVRSAGTGSNFFFGMAKSTFQFISQYTNDAFNFSDIWGVATDGQKFGNGSGESSYGSALSSGDILQLAFDLDNGKFYAGKNGTYFNSGDPAGGTNAAFTNVPTGESMQPFYGSSTSGVSHTFNFGQDSSFAGNHATENSNADSKGHGSFAYAPPSGYLALCSQNLPDAAIIDGTENFNTVLYTGNGSSRSITGVGFQPDWIWFKARSQAHAHLFFDSVRGATKYLQSNSDSAEGTESNSQTSFDSDGFSLGTDSTTGVNQNSTTYVAWNWKINAGTESNVSAGGSSNIRLVGGGTADQAAVQANTTAGISVVSFENTVRAADGFCTFPHGLGSAPDMVWLKSRTSSNYWAIYHSALGLKLGFLGNSLGNNAFISSTFWNAVSDSTVKFQSNGNLSATDEDIIAYCFKSIEGYSRAGSFVGNNSTSFVHTGFRVAWLMIKNADEGTGANWGIFDNTRPDGTGATSGVKFLQADLSNAEGNSGTVSCFFFSNGFEIGTSNIMSNKSGDNFIYLAFADQPFKFSNAR